MEKAAVAMTLTWRKKLKLKLFKTRNFNDFKINNAILMSFFNLWLELKYLNKFKISFFASKRAWWGANWYNTDYRAKFIFFRKNNIWLREHPMSDSKYKNVDLINQYINFSTVKKIWSFFLCSLPLSLPSFGIVFQGFWDIYSVFLKLILEDSFITVN